MIDKPRNVKVRTRHLHLYAFSLAVFMMMSVQLIAQTQISGKVISTKGLTISGVSVKNISSGEGTVTDEGGKFKIGLSGTAKSVIKITHVGFITQTLRMNHSEPFIEPIVITLIEDIRTLNEITIGQKKKNIHVERLPDIHDVSIMAGKKTESVQLSGVNGNLSEKTGRQIFAKIPGVFVYDMDGSGNQINISTRGLDPHRSWEYNIRQNGVITNSDMYAYPASHYSPAMESIERIEMVRGTGSLQYGAQLGGMINYVTKSADTTKKFGFESINSAGSYGLFSSYNAIGGKVGKLSYFAYYQKRHSNGYRKNARSDAESQFASLSYEMSRNVNLKVELGRSSYIYQIPGPLTDAMFAADPRQATRSRNYFNPDIYVPSAVLDWRIGNATKLRLTTSGVYGNRNSVMYDAFANVKDSINPATNEYKARVVDIDNFKSFTTELRLIHQYRLGQLPSVLSGGVQYMHNNLRRRQLGKGTTSSDFNLSVTDPIFGRDMYMKTKNIAFFMENLLHLTSRWSVSPGLRIESGGTDMTGSITYYKPDHLPNTIRHHFPLFGISSQYTVNDHHKIYSGFSQSYRPVVFKDIIPASTLEKVDKNLADASGYNIEAGISGNFGQIFNYDISLFQIYCKNRMGKLSVTDQSAQAYILRTTTGNTVNNGIELFAEFTPIHMESGRGAETLLSVFTSSSFFDAHYTKGSVIVNNENTSVSGNRVEGVPRWITRNGLQLQTGRLFATLQYSYVSSHFSDPANTVTPIANGTKGKVPSYGLWDLNGTLRLGNLYTLKLGVNNILNKQYYTKRPTMYPGAGIWSSDGRSVVVSFGIKI